MFFFVHSTLLFECAIAYSSSIIADIFNELLFHFFPQCEFKHGNRHEHVFHFSIAIGFTNSKILERKNEFFWFAWFVHTWYTCLHPFDCCIAHSTVVSTTKSGNKKKIVQNYIFKAAKFHSNKFIEIYFQTIENSYVYNIYMGNVDLWWTANDVCFSNTCHLKMWTSSFSPCIAQVLPPENIFWPARFSVPI